MITGRKRQLFLSDNSVLAQRNGVSVIAKKLNKIGAAVTQQTPPEMGGDVQMALQPAVIKDPFTDPATGITYQYRLYAILGNMLGTCCHYRSLALYLSNDGVSWIRPSLGQVEFPCGSGNKANNIVKYSGGLPFKWQGNYYAFYNSYGCGESDRWEVSADGVTNWQPAPGVMSALFMDTHYQDGAITVKTSPVDFRTREYTRGWLRLKNPGSEISPPYVSGNTPDIGRTAVWEYVDNFPNSTSLPLDGSWTYWEVQNGHGKPDLHNASKPGQVDVNAVQFPAVWDSQGAVEYDVYTQAVSLMSEEIDPEMEHWFLSLNTHYHYQDCGAAGYYSYARDGAKFIMEMSAPYLERGVYDVDADGGYFFVGFGGVLVDGGNSIMHYYAAAKNGGKPGCPNRAFMPGNQSIQMAKIRLDGYYENRLTPSGDALTTDIEVPSDGAGSVLYVNCKPYAASGSVAAQVETTSGAVIPGFAFADCVAVSGDHVKTGAIHWTGGTLKSLAGQIVRIRFKGDTGIYSFWMKSDNLTASYANLTAGVGQAVNHAPVINADSPITGVSVVGGALPAGIVLDANTGVLSGSAAQAGNGAAQIKIASYGNEEVVSLTWSITPTQNCVAPAFSFSSLVSAKQGAAFSVIPTGVQNVHHFEHLGMLQSGLALDVQTGEIRGTPVGFGTLPLTIRAYNSCAEYTDHVVLVRVEQAEPHVDARSPEIIFGDGYVSFVVTTQIPNVQTVNAQASIVDQFQISAGVWQITLHVTNLTDGAQVCVN